MTWMLGSRLSVDVIALSSSVTRTRQLSTGDYSLVVSNIFLCYHFVSQKLSETATSWDSWLLRVSHMLVLILSMLGLLLQFSTYVPTDVVVCTLCYFLFWFASSGHTVLSTSDCQWMLCSEEQLRALFLVQHLAFVRQLFIRRFSIFLVCLMAAREHAVYLWDLWLSSMRSVQSGYD